MNAVSSNSDSHKGERSVIQLGLTKVNTVSSNDDTASSNDEITKVNTVSSQRRNHKGEHSVIQLGLKELNTVFVFSDSRIGKDKQLPLTGGTLSWTPINVGNSVPDSPLRELYPGLPLTEGNSFLDSHSLRELSWTPIEGILSWTPIEEILSRTPTEGTLSCTPTT